MFIRSIFVLAVCVRDAFAVPYSHDATSLVIARAADSSTCPGYTATNIDVTDSGLTADLTLAGVACNAYSEDLQELKLVVEHQTGNYSLLIHCNNTMTWFIFLVRSIS